MEMVLQKSLFYRVYVKMERVMGIEPTWPVWKTGTLPLSYTRRPAGILARRSCLSIRRCLHQAIAEVQAPGMISMPLISGL
jgi:hypothetical protein